MSLQIRRPHASADVDAIAFADALAARWATELREQFLGAYLIGSLAHGGYSRRYSDIDLALTTVAGIASTAIDEMRVAANAMAPRLAGSVSLFWTDRHFVTGRFPLLDRLDYLDHAVTLVERERVRPDRPTIAEVRSYLCGPPFHNWRENARHFARYDALDPKDYKSYLRALLYPARFVYSWRRGSVTSNDEAVAFLREGAPPGLDIELIARALECRQADSDPVVLFSARKRLLNQVEACTRLIVA
jgi:predicted nucleotidyltransferase